MNINTTGKYCLTILFRQECKTFERNAKEGIMLDEILVELELVNLLSDIFIYCRASGPISRKNHIQERITFDFIFYLYSDILTTLSR